MTNCHALKLPAADGKKRLTDMADLQGIFRLIQSVPSKKAEPVKQWLAKLGKQRIDQMIDPELTFQMAVEDYRRQGYSDKWINERMRSIEMRKELTDEWHRAGYRRNGRHWTLRSDISPHRTSPMLLRRSHSPPEHSHTISLWNVLPISYGKVVPEI